MYPTSVQVGSAFACVIGTCSILIVCVLVTVSIPYVPENVQTYVPPFAQVPDVTFLTCTPVNEPVTSPPDPTTTALPVRPSAVSSTVHTILAPSPSLITSSNVYVTAEATAGRIIASAITRARNFLLLSCSTFLSICLFLLCSVYAEQVFQMPDTVRQGPQF